MSPKILPISKMSSVIGRRVFGIEFHKYGMPYTNGLGIITERHYPGVLDYMFLALERFPEIHPVSYMIDGCYLNRYAEGAHFHLLHYGSSDPTFEFRDIQDHNSKDSVETSSSTVGFVDLSKNSLSKDQEFVILCLKNRLTSK